MFRARRTFIATSLVALLAVAGVTAAIAADPAPAPPPRIAFLANGIVPADALAAGPIAGQLGAPVYTTQQDALPAGTAAALDAYGPQLVIVMGGPVAISEAVVTQVSAATGLPAVDPTPTPTTGVVRAAGGDRFETATIVADLLAAYAPAYLPVDLQAVDADKLDGKDASAFALKSDLGAGGGDADTLDGKDSTDFLGKTQKASDADKLDGKDSGAFLGATEKAADADLLDGKDATEFLAADGSVPLDGPLTYSTPQTRRLFVPSRSFKSTDAVTYTGVGARGTGTADLFAPVVLPDGAQITHVTGYFFDTDGSVNLIAGLRTDAVSSGSASQVGPNTGTTGDSGLQTSGPFGTSDTVDANGIEYWVRVAPTGGGSWSGSLGFEGFEITYEVSSEG